MRIIINLLYVDNKTFKSKDKITNPLQIPRGEIHLLQQHKDKNKFRNIKEVKNKQLERYKENIQEQLNSELQDIKINSTRKVIKVNHQLEFKNNKIWKHH